MDAGTTDPAPTAGPRSLPWRQLGRAVGASLDAKRVILGALGLVLVRGGRAALAALFHAPSPAFWPEAGTLPTVDLASWVRSSFVALTGPYRQVVEPFVPLFRVPMGAGEAAHAALAGVWGVVVWGLVGGAIARIAVVQAAAGERVGLVPAVRFAARRWLPLILTPLSPFLGVGFLAALCVPFGLLYRIPGWGGAAVGGALAFVPLLIGLVLALILVGLAAGWPLMLATVAAEGEDGFDALSRSYSYVFQRPGTYLLAALACLASGVLGLAVVEALARLTAHLAGWGLSLGGPDSVIAALYLNGPEPVGPAAPAHAAWLRGVGLLVQGWLFGYFWTAASLIYLLLRRDVDGTPWHDVYQPEHDADTFAPDEPTDLSATSPAV